ncbi:acyl-CoA dehydrogenase family protein [Streptomyces sp. RKAG290]|uniref:acyl-CoA dehydrogenase family protein n=1 Tax=Streptomyces sp. RKAG290 TaxID=2888348 RepID=UPI002033A1EC|nr:acyl-CoA dehydrogenase family protein [Streptomyces sp. RKAG290]MCM2416305.1 acyl-CoA dehydrogenase family protein [Streptomyces sp. RKAG290]
MIPDNSPSACAVSPLDLASHPFRAQVRTALEEAVLPHAETWEQQGHIPAEGWRALADAGLFGLAAGGPGFAKSAILLEELGRTGFAGVRAAVSVHAYMASSYIDRFGTVMQQEKYLPAVRTGSRVGALALSEQDAGTALDGITTRAEPDGTGGYRVKGRKLHVANGSQAGFYICLVRLRDIAGRPRTLAGCGLLIIDADTPGVSAHPEPMLGWRAADVCTITLDDVHVPGDRLIGKASRTLSYLMAALDFERLVAGLLAVGGADHCMGVTGAFVRTHRIGEAPLATHQAVRHALADLTAELDLVRAYAHRAVILHTQDRLDTRTASVLKLRATELAVVAARACMQYHGALGYLDDSVPARIYRDAVAGTVTAGASELMRDLIFEAAD